MFSCCVKHCETIMHFSNHEKEIRGYGMCQRKHQMEWSGLFAPKEERGREMISVEDESVTNKCKRRTNAMAHSFSNSRVDMPFLILPIASRRHQDNG